MHQFDVPSLLHNLHVFLHVDLGTLPLPPAIEEKRLSLLAQVVRLCYCTASLTVGESVNHQEPASPVPIYQSQSLNSATRALTSSSASLSYGLRGHHCSGQTGHSKRYSLPPECVSWTPVPAPAIPTATSTALPQWSSANHHDRYLRASTEPPLPPKLTTSSHHRASVTTTTTTTTAISNSDYEIPRALVATSCLTVSANRQSADEPISCSSGACGGLPRYLHMVGSPVRSFVNRLSLSPQSEVLLQSIASTQGLASTGAPATCSNSGHKECKDDTVLTLPKKCLSSQSRRCSAYMDCGWTLAGLLHHRVKPTKWIRLPCCFLTTASRLVGHKSLSAANPSSVSTAVGASPTLVLFLCGASAVYAGRDSGMEHVIKIAHPSWGTCALAAETEEQAAIWIRQVNQYAQGITPTERVSFLDQPGLSLPASGPRTSTTSNTAAPSTATTATCTSSETGLARAIAAATSVDQPDRHAPQSARHSAVELQDDSGFSAPISSGSEGNSADGVVLADSHGRPPDSELMLSARSHYSSAEDAPSSDGVGLQSSLTASPTNIALAGSKKSARRESLISSVRRKVESFSSKRWARKSLPQSFQSTVANATPTPTSVSHQLSKSASTTELVSTRQRTNSETSCLVVGDLLPAGPMGFGWAQLEWAANLLPRRGGGTSSGGHHVLSINGQSSLAKQSAKPGRPQSAIVDRSWYQRQQPIQSNHSSQLTDVTVTVGHQMVVNGDTVLLAALSTTTSASRIIVAGEAQICVPGRLPWTSLWCCLRSNCLDIYSLGSQPNGRPDGKLTMANGCPVFSLPLEPGQVEFGLAGDKRRKSALRLAAPGRSSASLLFDVAQDKLRMGSWIRGFIQALGIIPDPADGDSSGTQSSQANASNSSGDYPTTSVYGESLATGYSTSTTVTRAGSNTSTNLRDYDCPVGECDVGDVGQPREASLRLGDVTEEAQCCGGGSGGDVTATRYQQVPDDDNNNGNLYDDVCRPSYAGSLASFKHQWSSPLLFPTTVSSSYSSIMVCPSGQATGYLGDTSSWYIPPPSRRLLSQPLPPLPSVGPSGTESLAGTIASSRGATSASLTPDGVDSQGSSAGSPSLTADEVFIDWPGKSSIPCAPEDSTYWSPKPGNGLLPSEQRCHLSYSLTSQVAAGEYAHVGVHRQPSSPVQGTQQQPSDYDYAVNYRLGQWLGDTAGTMPAAANTSAPVVGGLVIAATTASADDDNATSCVSGTHVGNRSTYDLLLSHSTAATEDWCLPTGLPPLDMPLAGNFMTAAWLLPQAVVAAARRSVSCITGSKPTIPIAPLVTAATLPTRCNCLSPLAMVTSLGGTSTAGSFSSRTATSGVSSTLGLSSSSSASLSLGKIVGEHGSSTASLAPLPVAEEEHEVDDNCPLAVEGGSRSLSRQQPPAGEAPEPSASSAPVTSQQTELAAAAAWSTSSVDKTWVVELASHQLEEVRDEVEKLRRRRKTLSFRLSRQLTNGSGSSNNSRQASPLVTRKPSDNNNNNDGYDFPTAGQCPTVSGSSPPTDGEAVPVSSGTSTSTASTVSCCSTTSLCARLAIVEAMLSQAEQTEARLLQDLNSLTLVQRSSSTGATTAGLVLAAGQQLLERQSCRANPGQSSPAGQTTMMTTARPRDEGNSPVVACSPSPGAIASSPNHHHHHHYNNKPTQCLCGTGNRQPVARRNQPPGSFEQQHHHYQQSGYHQPQSTTLGQGYQHPRGGGRRPPSRRNGGRGGGSRWRRRQPVTSPRSGGAGGVQPPSAEVPQRWLPVRRGRGSVNVPPPPPPVTLMGITAVCSLPQ